MKTLLLALIPVISLSSCRFNSGTAPKKPIPSIPGKPLPSKPGNERPHQDPEPQKVTREVRLYHYNLRLRHNVPFLRTDGSLPSGKTYDSGHGLPGDMVIKLYKSLNATEAPGTEVFRPQDAIVYFDSARKPLYCVEISATTGAAHLVNPYTDSRLRLKNPQTALLLLRHATHFNDMIQAPH